MEENIVFWNPWWNDSAFEFNIRHRFSFDGIEPLLKRKEILFFSGVRRSGKTSFMYYLISKLLEEVNPKNILYLNLDDQVLRFEKLKIIYQTYKDFFPELEGKIYVFLDEIQNIDGWEVFVKNMYDSFENVKFIISGSKSHVLKRKSTLLTGRLFEFEVYPLSFDEFLEFNNYDVSKLNLIENKPLKLFVNYMKFGGFPEVVLEKNERLKISLVKEYFENIKDKDIITYFNIKDSRKFDRLALFVVSNLSKFFSASKLGVSVNLSTQVVGDYLDYSELMYLFLSLNHYNYSIKSQITNPRKIYSVDTGFYNSVSFNFSENKGRIIENMVFLQLKRQGKEIYYHKEKKECDFVIKEGLNIADAIQVCYNLNEDNRKREVDGLLDAMNSYDLKEGLILTYDQDEIIKMDSKRIIVKSVWKWLLEY